MPNDNILKYGILRCRDLVELYYGVRMVVSVYEHALTIGKDPAFSQIMTQDPRRVYYEIYFDNQTAGNDRVWFGAQTQVIAQTSPVVDVNQQASKVIRRSFLTDLDGVVLEVWAMTAEGALTANVRETLLTPAPIDEVPLG